MNKSNTDEVDYFAADYNFGSNNYTIKISLDIENYDACVVLIIAI